MTCRTFIEFLSEYLNGELAPEERATFDAHLAECPWCVAYLRTYQEATRMSKAAFADEPNDIPADMPEELIQAILAAIASGEHK